MIKYYLKILQVANTTQMGDKNVSFILNTSFKRLKV